MEILMPFDTDDPQFIRGFECGRVWALLRTTDDEFGPETMHGVNAEMVMRLAESTGRTATSEEVGDDWIEVTFSETGEAS